MWRYGIKMTFWFLAIVAIIGLAVMELWNWLIPALFNGNMVNYWQALGILALARLLTGFGRGAGHWKHRLHNRWTGMSEEERNKLRAKFRDRWCRSEEE
jgi:hypothetical protein